MAVKHCIVCGQEFIDFGRGKYCDGPHYKQCEVCGKMFEYDVRAQVIPKTCSHRCSGTLAHRQTLYQPKVCIQCGTWFTPTTGNQKVCKNCRNLLDKFGSDTL